MENQVKELKAIGKAIEQYKKIHSNNKNSVAYVFSVAKTNNNTGKVIKNASVGKYSSDRNNPMALDTLLTGLRKSIHDGIPTACKEEMRKMGSVGDQMVGDLFDTAIKRYLDKQDFRIEDWLNKEELKKYNKLTSNR